jgi:hypothetical protein
MEWFSHESTSVLVIDSVVFLKYFDAMATWQACSDLIWLDDETIRKIS